MESVPDITECLFAYSVLTLQALQQTKANYLLLFHV